jgi:peptidyl-prolyl cis-trans isomerase B (cyclophilin B)
MSRRLLLVPAAVLALSFLAGCSGDDDTARDNGDDPADGSGQAATPPDREPTGVQCTYDEDPMGAIKENSPPPSDAVVSGEVPVTFETTVGTFNATLDADRTPCTVNSFVSLADQNYFNGTGCHRLVTSGIFVLQCGDPSESGTGGPGYQFDDELDGSETYPAGTLAMANAGPNTNGSQFFIVYDETRLPPSYTVFGSVDEETVALVQEVADAGTNDANGPGDGAPNTPVGIEQVTAG